MRAVVQALGVTVALAITAPAAADNLFERNFWLSGPEYDGGIPACGDPAVEAEITERFMQAEAGVWKSSARIRAFSGTRETAFRPWGEGYIPRRFCAAHVAMNTGKVHAISYEILEDQGLSGMSFGVRWCIDAYDRQRVFAPGCSMVEP